MTIAAGPFMIGAVLLAVGGALKTAYPHDTAYALRTAGLPVRDWWVRAGGALEGAVGAYAVVVGDRVAATLVAASFVAFTLFVALALHRRLPIASCGCLGKADTPPSAVHVVVNAALALAAVAVAVEPGVGLADVVADQPLGGAPFLVLVATGVALVFVVLTTLPRTLALVERQR